MTYKNDINVLNAKFRSERIKQKR